ncbi:MAG: DEAD/DEAH box helicase, partial [Planctomycetales bacterium]|nr:DEAD/DEAH box helicase [Planctomycetales bacterium]
MPAKSHTRQRKTPRIQKENAFHQRLGGLTYSQACALLGDNGAQLLRQGDQAFDIDLDRDVYLGGDLLRVRIEDKQLTNKLAIVTLTQQSARRRQLQANCDQCDAPCVHLGAGLHYLLDSKTSLGLAAPPDESVPLEHLTKEELLQRAMADRQKRADEEKMTMRATNPKQPWSDYIVTSHGSGKTYRVALRGFSAGESYCSCADFRTNQLEICKHIFSVQAKVRKRFSVAQLKKPYKRVEVSLSVCYGDPFGLLFHLPHKREAKLIEFIGDAAVTPTTDAHAVLNTLTALNHAGYDVKVYPDAEQFIQRHLVQDRLRKACATIAKSADSHALRTELLNATLLPYQLEGIAFCVAAGRAILADDMGLGKTIQAIGVAELLARQADIRRVLIICPASLKSQWDSEIRRFSGRSTQIVSGTAQERTHQYQADAFFTICNYEQVVRDEPIVESAEFDLIVLDEGQRIKNWESKTSRSIRQLQSTFRLVLSGTPLENRLGELYTVVKFVDERLLGPAYEFFHQHHVVDERGKTLAYHRLDELRVKLKPILLRRKRAEVARQLPDRTDEIVRIVPTQEQADICFGNMATAARILSQRFLTEMDLLRLQKALLIARMACNSTFLVNKEEPEYSSKLERLHELLTGLLEDPTRKIVVFSEWCRMLSRIEKRLATLNVDWVRLDGQVPQKRRGSIVSKFQKDANCRLILMSNAGSTGLNLQAANTVINVDLPWNPAVLEQRIARAHRMGQKNPVHVYKLVTVGDTIEERLLTTLANKQDLADASIDMDSEITQVAMASGMENLKKQLEVVLTPRPEAAIDGSMRNRVDTEVADLQNRRERVSEASGQLIAAALSLAGGLIAADPNAPVDTERVDALTQRLSDCVEHDEAGRPQLRITLPDAAALRGL